MKKCFLILVVFLVVLALAGCSSDNISPIDVPSVEDSRFTDDFEMELVGESVNGGFSYWRDKATDVVYVRFRDKSGYAGYGGLSVMLDPETGLPLTYARYMEIYNQVEKNAEQEKKNE